MNRMMKGSGEGEEGVSVESLDVCESLQGNIADAQLRLYGCVTPAACSLPVAA